MGPAVRQREAHQHASEARVRERGPRSLEGGQRQQPIAAQRDLSSLCIQ